MIKQLQDGRYHVVVRCADHVTRQRIVFDVGTAQFSEVLFLAKWYAQFPEAPGRKNTQHRCRLPCTL
jgi:hypothetical protein